MARNLRRPSGANRAPIYARVSDKSQDGEDKTSLSEQTADMETYCARKDLRIVARYQEVWPGLVQETPGVPAHADRGPRGGP